LWKGLLLRPERVREIQTTARRIVKGRDRYEKVAAATGVPWHVVGLIHALECGLSFDDHLHNGDPLTERTVHVPRGRPVSGNPPFTWEESAIDALGFDGLSNVGNWCVERIAYMLESYNGWGYRSKGIPTPYLWSATNQYAQGKFIRDHVYDPTAVSEQSGALAILTVMRDLESSVVLTFFDGGDAAHAPETAVLPPAGIVPATKPKSTIPGDSITVASSIGIIAVLANHNPAPSPAVAPAAPASQPTSVPPAVSPSPQTAVAPAAPAPTVPVAAPAPQPASPSTGPAPTTPAVTVPPASVPANSPPPASPPPPSAAASPTTVSPAPASPPSALAQKPLHPAPPRPPAKTTTVTMQPAHPISAVVDQHYAILLGVLIVVLLIGLYLAWKARNARAKSAQRFVNAVPQLISSAVSDGDLASAPLVATLRTRLLTVAWIVATIIVNVIALAKLLQYFHLAQPDWYQPFYWFGTLYDNYAQHGFSILGTTTATQYGFDIATLPWLLPFIVLYLSTASAFMVANSGLLQRDTSAQTLWGAVVHAGWLFAIPAFIMDALRYRVVTQFARQNTVLFFAYVATFVGCYAGVRFINDDLLGPYTKAHPAVVMTVEQEIRRDAGMVIPMLPKN